MPERAAGSRSLIDNHPAQDDCGDRDCDPDGDGGWRTNGRMWRMLEVGHQLLTRCSAFVLRLSSNPSP